MKYKLIFIFFFVPIWLFATNYSIGDSLTVVAMNGLIVRNSPNDRSEKLEILQTGEKVYVLDTYEFKKYRDTIFGFVGNWISIQTDHGIIGYVFDSFLSNLPMGYSKLEHWEGEISSEALPMLLSQYVLDNFEKSGCSFSYFNRFDGDNTHSMDIQMFVEGHTMISHGYWEGNATELKLNNVRLSEIFYLVHQLLPKSYEKLINDSALRNPTKIYDYRNFVVDEEVVIYKNKDDSFSLIFSFPCC